MSESRLGELSGRQREIVEASIDLISKGGIQKLTIKNLAASLGLSEPALYRHFKSKQDILSAILDFFRKQQMDAYAWAAARESSPLRILESTITAVFRNFSAKPAMITVVFAEGMFQNHARLSKAVFSIMEDRQVQFTDLIAKGQANGEVRRDIAGEQLASIVMGSMRMILTRWRLSRFAFDLVAEGESFCGALRKLLK